jgi:carboxylesterase type B
MKPLHGLLVVLFTGAAVTSPIQADTTALQFQTDTNTVAEDSYPSENTAKDDLLNTADITDEFDPTDDFSYAQMKDEGWKPSFVEDRTFPWDDDIESWRKDPQLHVLTENGPILGRIEKRVNEVRQFLGIPFAEAPIGQRRWQSPQKPASWHGKTRLAVRQGPACPQIVIITKQSEDCLYLDVYTPIRSRHDSRGNKPLPVLVWIHGGAWIIGSGQMLGSQDATYMVHHKDVIIVSINYRLGPLGFMVTKDLKGNYGLEDQRLALQWVKRNIAAFGGDPSDVTVWGESAGAMSITFHLTSPKSTGLFQRVIMQSNVFGVNYRTREEATEVGNALTKRLGCELDDINCLRSKSAFQVNYLRMPLKFHNQKRFLGDILLVGHSS